MLFIERILKMLKPGGRAAIVLPQGKFNNSSLAFIREWILKKARLLAVVGLHPNTFKPHTGTKTSVLFVQKYTQEQLDQIAKVHDKVAGACPDYEAEIKSLLKTHQVADGCTGGSHPRGSRGPHCRALQRTGTGRSRRRQGRGRERRRQR